MSKILVLDGNSNAYAAFYAYRNFRHKGEKVGLVYGFVSMLRAVANTFKPTKIYICWDHSKHARRMEINPNYKGHRKEKKAKSLFDYEDFNRQKDLAMRVVESLGVRQIRGEGMEADDYVYWVVKKLRKNNKVIIVSADKDFHQLLTHPNVSMWDTKKKVRLHKSNLTKYYPYKPEQCVDYLSLLGDKSDDITGYPGVGEVKAAKFLEEFGSIREFLANRHLEFSPIDKKKLKEIYKVNRELISLPFFFKKNKITEKHSIDFFNNKRNPKFDEKAFDKFCQRWGFNSFKKPNFTKPFER